MKAERQMSHTTQIDYLQHPVLGERLIRLSDAALRHFDAGKEVAHVLGGSTDATKLKQSASLFVRAARELGHEEAATVFEGVLKPTGEDGEVSARWEAEGGGAPMETEHDANRKQ